MSDLEATAHFCCDLKRKIEIPCFPTRRGVPVHILGEVSPRPPAANSRAAVGRPSPRATPAAAAATAAAPLAVHEEGDCDP